MKIQIRQGVFETNSSSTHALAIFNASDWERFKKGEMLIKNYPETPELVECEGVEPSEIYNPDTTDDCWDEFSYFTYDIYRDLGCYDIIFKKLDDKLIMSLYGEAY